MEGRAEGGGEGWPEKRDVVKHLKWNGNEGCSQRKQMFPCSPLAVWENYCPVTTWHVGFPPSWLAHYLKHKTKGGGGASQERIPLSPHTLIMEIWLIYSGATMNWVFVGGGGEKRKLFWQRLVAKGFPTVQCFKPVPLTPKTPHPCCSPNRSHLVNFSLLFSSLNKNKQKTKWNEKPPNKWKIK